MATSIPSSIGRFINIFKLETARALAFTLKASKNQKIFKNFNHKGEEVEEGREGEEEDGGWFYEKT